MTRLFIELYLDEDADVLVAHLLRARGFVATTTRDEGQLQKSDAEQLAYAVSQQKAIMTHTIGLTLKCLLKHTLPESKYIIASL